MKKQWHQLMALIRRFMAFIHHELWEVELTALPQPRRMLVRLLRTAHLVIRGIKQDNIPLHASALALGTLVSIVPILAIMFSMYRGLGAGQEDIDGLMGDWMQEMPEQFQAFVDQMLDQYASLNFAALGGIFLVFVLIMVIKMLGSIEESFNKVWYISDSRNILRKISNYISVLVIVPILVVAASATSALIGGYMSEQMASVAWIWRSLLRLGPLFAVWIAFSFLYVFVPNTQVKIGPGLISGFVGALMWLAWQSLYIDLQVGVSNYNAIYGTFASVPIFLGWLYISWIIILLGAEVAFAVQNAETYRLERTASDASTKSKLLIGIGIMQRAAESLNGTGQFFSSNAFAMEAKVSIRLVNEMVRLFERAGLLGALADRPGCYVLLKSAEQLTLKQVLDAIWLDGTKPEELGLDHLDPAVQTVMRDMDAGLTQNLKEMKVSDLIRAA
jgi:membrane protein